MKNVMLTDTYGDPVMINWDFVALTEEIREDDSDVPGGRRFVDTQIWFVGGGSRKTRVKESLPTIIAKLEMYGG